jgi:hypothetical protein
MAEVRQSSDPSLEVSQIPDKNQPDPGRRDLGDLRGVATGPPTSEPWPFFQEAPRDEHTGTPVSEKSNLITGEESEVQHDAI